MTNTYRALCAELLADYDSCRYRSELADRARALLAEPEAEGPTDEELRDLWSWSAGQDQGPWPTQQHCFARAVLACWGRPAAAPVPEPGEVGELVAWLRETAASLQEGSISTPRLDRAATLLQQQAAPVPVSERLPGPEDCDAEGRCWLGGHQMGSGTRTWLLGYPAWAERFPDVHHFWLPAAALPLPPYEGGEVQP